MQFVRRRLKYATIKAIRPQIVKYSHMERDFVSQWKPHPRGFGSRLLRIVRFEVPMPVITKLVVFWVVTPFSLVNIYRCRVLHRVIFRKIISPHCRWHGNLKPHEKAIVHFIPTFGNHCSALKMEAARIAEAVLGIYQATSQNTN
jgi:hypothetical protein